MDDSIIQHARIGVNGQVSQNQYFGLEWALYLARSGCAVFPIIPDRKTPYKRETINQVRGLPEDHPGGFHQATTDEIQIRALWSGDRERAWIGIATGAKSGVCVLDLDKKDGKDGYASLHSAGHIIPNTPSSFTLSGGQHHYFCIPRAGSQKYTSDSGVIGDGVDRRGDGGYVVYYGADLTQPMSAPPEWMLAGGGVVQGGFRPREGYKPLGTDRAPSFDAAAQALSAHDAGADYEEWRDNLAAFRQSATGQADDATIETTARLWSMSAPDRYNEATFNKVWRSLNGGTVLGWSYLRDRALKAGTVPADVEARWRGLPGGAVVLPGGSGGTVPQPAPGGAVPGGVVPAPGNDFLRGESGESTFGKPVSSEAFKVIRDAQLPIGFNEFKQEIAVTGRLPWDAINFLNYPRTWLDVDDAGLRMFIQQFQGMGRIAKDATTEALLLYADRRRFNPVVDYLNGVKWDGVPRLDRLFSNYFQAENIEFANLVSPKFLIGMVARALEPGCKRDEMAILEGEQGAQKSTALNVIAGGDEYFADSLPNMHDKDAKMLLHGNWLIEVGELTGMSKSDVRDVKAFVASKTDKYRPPYGRSVITVPRSSVFAATTNADAYLRDPTGARRFWPIRCGQIDLEGLRRDRDQLFAEAVTRYRAGERYWLDGAGEIALAKVETDERQERDPWHDAVATFANGRAALGIPVFMHDVLKFALNLTEVSLHDKAKTSRVSDILRIEGFIQKRLPMPNRPRGYIKF